MARKNYQVKAKTAEAWQRIHKELLSDGANENHIPSRKCISKDNVSFSPTRGSYQLSLSEVEELKNHPDIDYVEIDTIFHPEYELPMVDNINRFDTNVKNYRAIYEMDAPEVVKDSLMCTTGLLNQGTTNWVKVAPLSGNSPGMQYWDTLPLLKDYGVYPAVPADTTQPDPESTRNSTQLCESAFTIDTSGFYQLEVSIDAAEGEVEVYTPTTNPTTVRYPLTGFNNYASANQKDVALNPRIEQNNPANHKFQVINLGWLQAWVGDKYHFKFQIKNGDFKNSWQESWDYNPGGLAWRLVRYPAYSPSAGGYATGINKDDTALTTIPPISNPTTAEKNRTGYQLLRCQNGAINAWTNKSSEVKTSDVTYTNDGYDIDLIICDGSVWNAHPEFITDPENDPPNYLPGNVLARHGKSGVLDIILDAPYYMDPHWFDADPDTRLEARWDGTPVPTESAALSWWSDKNSRSTTFTVNASLTQTQDIEIPLNYFDLYTRSRYCGQSNTPPTVSGSHGTPVASLAYGKNFGWAFNCNKWAIHRHGVKGRAAAFVRLFHLWKPDNPKTYLSANKKDPTVMNNSWGAGIYWNNSIGLNANNVNLSNNVNFQNSSGTFEYRGTSGTYPAQVDGEGYTIPKFAISPTTVYSGVYTSDGSAVEDNPSYDKHQYYDSKGFAHTLNTYFEPAKIPDTGAYNYASLTTPSWLSAINGTAAFHNTQNTDFREAIAAGVHVVFSAGNFGHYITKPGDVDYNNTVDSKFTNRRQFPSQVADDHDNAPSFVIGSMGTGLRDEWRMQADAPFKEGTSSDFDIKSEFIDSGIPYKTPTNLLYPTTGNWVDRNVSGEDYSERGSGVDFYAPSCVLAASAYDTDQDTGSNGVGKTYLERVESHPTGGKYFNDEIFSGTSAAAPVAAGLIACALQQNRSWSPKTAKDTLLNSISGEDNKFYRGYSPGSDPNDPKWMGAYSTMGSSVKIIKEYISVSSANKSLTPWIGISQTRPINERFTISHNSPSIIHKVEIHGVREFLESDDSTPLELSIASGTYPIRISTDENLNLNLYKYRLRSTNNLQKLQVSVDEGDTWGDFEIIAETGAFLVHNERQAFYIFNRDDNYTIGSGGSVTNSTYSISPANFTVNEGTTLVTTFSTTNVAASTVLYWSLNGISSTDLSSGDLEGNVTVTADGSAGSISHAFTNDNVTEGDESFEIRLYTDSARTVLVKKVTITLKDTSNAGGTTNEPDPYTPGTGGYNNKIFPDDIKRTHTNGSTTVETAGPYFTGSVPIKFSEIGKYFKNGYTVGNKVKASEYFRNTNPVVYDSNVPNATENEFESDKTTTKISGDAYPDSVFSGNGTNLSLETFRGSIKRYYATVGDFSNVGSTIIKNYSMNRWDGSNGIDWDNRNHRDSTSRSDGNLIRNVEKKIFINATCYSDDIGTSGSAGSLTNGLFDKKPGAKLEEPTLAVRNSVIFINGRVLGSGGVGGYRSSGSKGSSDPGKHGGTALKIKHTGSTTFIYVHKDGQLYGGGGGGESGAMGAAGSNGSCVESGRNYTTVSICPVAPGGGFNLSGWGCPSGWSTESSGSGGICYSETDPVTGETTRAHSSQWWRCYQDYSYSLGSGSGAAQGIGGRGGNGKGLYQATTNGQGGTPGGCPSCPQGGSLSGGACGSDGSKGGNGGEWGAAGANTDGKGEGSADNGGNGGPAVCGSPFVVSGDITTENIKGDRDGECDGREQVVEPDPREDPPIIEITPLPTYVRFDDGANRGMVLHVTAPTGQTPEAKCDFRLRSVKRDSSRIDDVPFSSVQIKDSTGAVRYTLDRGPEIIDCSLENGDYTLNWNNLRHTNTEGHAQSGQNQAYNGDGSDGTTLELGRVSSDLLEIKLRDGTSPDDDAEITLLNSANAQAGLADSNWVKAYQTGIHGTASESNGWYKDLVTDEGKMYRAHNEFWHAFLREVGVTPSLTEIYINNFPAGWQTGDAVPATVWQTQVYKFNLTTDSRAKKGSIKVTPGTFKLKVMADNVAQIDWNSATYNKTNAVYTSDYRGHDGFANHVVNEEVVENQVADIPVSFAGGSTTMEITLTVRLRNNPNDGDGVPMGAPFDHTRNPLVVGFEVLDTTGTRIFSSLDLPGTEKFRPAEVGYKIDGRFSTVFGNSADLDWAGQIGSKTREVNEQTGLIELAPNVAVSPVEYILTAQGEGVDRTDVKTFNIR